MYTTYRMKADELNEDFVQSLKTLFHGQNIEVVVSNDLSANLEPSLERKAGALKGRITIADDFNAPLADFTDYEQ
jgi:hypothetical protein